MMGTQISFMPLLHGRNTAKGWGKNTATAALMEQWVGDALRTTSSL